MCILCIALVKKVVMQRWLWHFGNSYIQIYSRFNVYNRDPDRLLGCLTDVCGCIYRLHILWPGYKLSLVIFYVTRQKGIFGGKHQKHHSKDTSKLVGLSIIGMVYSAVYHVVLGGLQGRTKTNVIGYMAPPPKNIAVLEKHNETGIHIFKMRSWHENTFRFVCLCGWIL